MPFLHHHIIATRAEGHVILGSYRNCDPSLSQTQ